VLVFRIPRGQKLQRASSVPAIDAIVIFLLFTNVLQDNAKSCGTKLQRHAFAPSDEPYEVGAPSLA
jgi:hypothetical protein